MLTACLLVFIVAVSIAQASRQPHVRRAGGMPASRPQSVEPAARFRVAYEQTRPMLSEPERNPATTGQNTAGSTADTAVASGSLSTYRGLTARQWAARFRHRTRQLQAARATLKHRWAPTVDYALTLASAVFNVPRADLSRVSWCESTHNPFARNGGQLGLFQLGWRPFGLDPFDPVANALSAAQTVVHDGGWRQWVCKP